MAPFYYYYAWVGLGIIKKVLLLLLVAASQIGPGNLSSFFLLHSEYKKCCCWCCCYPLHLTQIQSDKLKRVFCWHMHKLGRGNSRVSWLVGWLLANCKGAPASLLACSKQEQKTAKNKNISPESAQKIFICSKQASWLGNKESKKNKKNNLPQTEPSSRAHNNSQQITLLSAFALLVVVGLAIHSFSLVQLTSDVCVLPRNTQENKEKQKNRSNLEWEGGKAKDDDIWAVVCCLYNTHRSTESEIKEMITIKHTQTDRHWRRRRRKGKQEAIFFVFYQKSSSEIAAAAVITAAATLLGNKINSFDICCNSAKKTSKQTRVKSNFELAAAAGAGGKSRYLCKKRQ